MLVDVRETINADCQVELRTFDPWSYFEQVEMDRLVFIDMQQTGLFVHCKHAQQWNSKLICPIDCECDSGK